MHKANGFVVYKYVESIVKDETVVNAIIGKGQWTWLYSCLSKRASMTVAIALITQVIKKQPHYIILYSVLFNCIKKYFFLQVLKYQQQLMRRNQFVQYLNNSVSTKILPPFKHF